MTAEVTLEIEVHELIQFLEKRHGLNLSQSSEYIVLKPRQVDDYLEFKVLYSDESHPKDWKDFKRIKEEWNELCE